MNIAEVEKYVLQQGSATVPQVQQKFSLSYAEARSIFKSLEEANKIKWAGGVVYESCTPAPLSDDPTVDALLKRSKDILNGAKPYMKKTPLSESGLSARLLCNFKMSSDYEPYEGNDDDDDDEDEDDDTDDIFFDDSTEDDQFISKKIHCRENLIQHRNTSDSKTDKQYATQSTGNVRLIPRFNYGEYGLVAKKMMSNLTGHTILCKHKAIQFGVDKTRYVFEILTPQYGMSAVKCRQADMRACAGTRKSVQVIAPWDTPDHFTVEVGNEQKLDPLCKKALVHWLTQNGGRASIASLQRGVGVGFVRASKIMDQLQLLRCVDTLAPDESSSTPVYVKIALEDVEVLFPKSLDWPD